MHRTTILTFLFALAAMAGQAQVKCHVEGTLETDAWGDEIIICEAGTDLRVVDEPLFHVKAKDGHFTYDIETDFPRLYEVFFLKQYETGSWFQGKFIADNCNVNVTMFAETVTCIVIQFLWCRGAYPTSVGLQPPSCAPLSVPSCAACGPRSSCRM